MPNTLQAASRLLIRVSIAAFTVIVLLLIQSAFWSNRVSLWMQIIIFATALLSYFRPQYGLLALAAVAPLGQVGSRTLDSNMRGAEALALAFLAGALVRGWTLREFRSFPSTRLETAVLVFGFIVAASCVEQMWFLQLQRDYPWPFIEGALAYTSRTYIATTRGFGMIFNAMLLLEGLALLLFVTKYVKASAGFARRLVVMLILGGLSTALLTFSYTPAQLVASRQMTITEFLMQRHWTVHFTDVNAAGSFFAMMMFIALGMALKERRNRGSWAVAGLVLAVTTWMTFSRTAFAAVILVGVCLAAIAVAGRLIGVGKAIAISGAGAVGMAVALWLYLGPTAFGLGALVAVRVRWLFLVTTWRMLQSEPIFGIGIGQYFLWSRHFAVPEMLKYYQMENAHNNFAQVAGELGMLGLAGFLTVLALATCRRWKPLGSYDVASVPILVGLAAFVLTWLGGHPLLVPEVAYPFWIGLGAVSLGLIATTQFRHAGPVAAAVLVLCAATLPMRVWAKSNGLDFTRVTYGLSERRVMTARARMFVPRDQSRIDIPLRARGASDREPVLVEVFVNDIAAASLSMTSGDWQRARIDLPSRSSQRVHEIELRIRQPDDMQGAEPPAVEVGKWEIIAKPNG